MKTVEIPMFPITTTASPAHPFWLGSIVKLKSGGVDMTVVGLGDDLSPNVEVAWQDESGVLQRSWLPAAALQWSMT